MLHEELKILIGDEVYIFASMHRVPNEVRRKYIAPQDDILDRAINDDVTMGKLRTALVEVSDNLGTHRPSNKEVIAQLKKALRDGSNRFVFARRKDLLLPNENARVIAWLDRARKSDMGAYTYLSLARNRDHLDLFDENLVAAERYMEGQDGNYNSTLIAASALLKSVREIQVFDVKPFSGIFGRNGSISIEFITRWGMLGAFDRENGISLDNRVDKELSGNK